MRVLAAATETAFSAVWSDIGPLVGTVVGALLGWGGQWLAQRAQRKRAFYEEKKEAYLNLLNVYTRWIDVMDRWLSTLDDRAAWDAFLEAWPKAIHDFELAQLRVELVGSKRIVREVDGLLTPLTSGFDTSPASSATHLDRMKKAKGDMRDGRNSVLRQMRADLGHGALS